MKLIRRVLVLIVLAVIPTMAGANSASGSFLSGTGAATTTVSVTGMAFQPSGVLLWSSASPGATGTDDMSMAFGVGISSSSRRAIWAGCIDNTDPSQCDNRVNNALVLMIYRGTTPRKSVV